MMQSHPSLQGKRVIRSRVAGPFDLSLHPQSCPRLSSPFRGRWLNQRLLQVPRGGGLRRVAAA